eukprot:GILJ01039889.1.p1 GENE.GILJ01039889.1~~GILJ01039889.1.p1  ORF type:complete len:106 (+),score=2.26 GILJ01039889.1:111-428(+)
MGEKNDEKGLFMTFVGKGNKEKKNKREKNKDNQHLTLSVGAVRTVHRGIAKVFRRGRGMLKLAATDDIQSDELTKSHKENKNGHCEPHDPLRILLIGKVEVRHDL